jgi:hypothetical protein
VWARCKADDDLDLLYREFTPIQKEVLPRHCDVITTGFDAGMMVDLIRLAAEGGYTPDLWVAPDLAGQGRPAPWMAFYAAQKLDLYPCPRL